MKRRYDKISTYFKENWIIVLPMCITALFFNGLMCIIPLIEGKTINSLKDGNYNLVVKYVIGFISLVLFVQINRFCKRYLVRIFGNKMSLKMREVSLNNLLNKDISYFTNNIAGDILNRNLSDIYDTTEGIRKMTTEVFDTIVLLLGYMISMFIMDWEISLYVSIFIILSIVIAQFMKSFVYKSNKDYKEYLSVNKQITLSKLNNELYYRGLGVSSEYNKNYASSVEILRKKNMKSLIFQSSLQSLYSSIAFIGVLFIAYMGGLNVMNDVYEIGTLTAYLTTFLLVAKKASRVGRVFNAYQGFRVSWVRCKDYLHDEEKIVYEDIIEDLNLQLRDFKYSYEGGFSTPIINLTAKKGDIIGICGRVHTGKSTIIKALTGLYQYQGEALLGGVDIIKIGHNKNQYISYCATDVSMFSDTLENNIKLGRVGDLKKAIEVSQLTDDLPVIGGLDVLMSHSTANISGGQQKRVQMARALYPETSLVLLDDPFQSVSQDMAFKMVDSLKEYKDEIVILVSNNYDVLHETDKIIYLEEDKAFVDTYEGLLDIPGFKKLMEVK